MLKKYWWIILLAVLVVIAIPLAVDWLIIRNSFPSNISNSDWVGFLGGYVGAIIGCAISLLGIIWTINFTREQNRADRELQIRPFFDIRYLDVDQFCHTKNWLGYVLIEIRDNAESSNTRTSWTSTGAGLLHLKNVGNGPATNITVQVEIEGLNEEYRAEFTNQNTKVTTNSILPGETATLSIDINNLKEAPKKDDFTQEEGSVFPMYDVVKFKFPESYVIKLKLCYADLMVNLFTQELIFKASYYMKTEVGKDAKYQCSLHLERIGITQITETK